MSSNLNSALTVSLIFVVSSTVIQGAVKEREVPEPPSIEIAEISTEEEFRALEPSLRLDGWEIRLAIAPGAASDIPPRDVAAPDFTLAPWRILFADFRRTEPKAKIPENRDFVIGHPIGALRYEFEFASEGKFPKHAELKALTGKIRRARPDLDHHRFAAILPTSEKGAYRVRVYVPGQTERIKEGREALPFAQSQWKQDTPVKSRWSEFARRKYVAGLNGLGIPVPDEIIFPFRPAAPEFDGFNSILGADTGIWEPLDDDPIPGMIGREPDPDFELSLAGSGLAIKIKDIGSRGSKNFIVRWWIDGKPVAFAFGELPEEAETEAYDGSGMAGGDFETRIPFRVPYGLKDAKPDSEITVQLLYCLTGADVLLRPHEFELARLGLGAEIKKSSAPRLSNRIEFRLGDLIDSK